MRPAQIFTLAAAIPAALAAIRGFNYDASGRNQAAFEGEFRSAQNLVGAPGYSSARLFTTIQSGTARSPISAIPAAINTGTTLLLGLWASAGQDNINNEIAALLAAVQQYGTAFTDLVVGISVGSEDIYRWSPLGQKNNAGIGVDAATVANYVGQVRNAIANTPLAGKPLGHVDTYNMWSDASIAGIAGLISAVDFIGMDAYPYFETTKANSIENSNATFWEDYRVTVAASQGKPVWITETGWPTVGPQMNLATPSVQNAEIYYGDVACSAFAANINTWWYILQDGDTNPAVPSFGLVGAGSPPPTQPKYSLAC